MCVSAYLFAFLFTMAAGAWLLAKSWLLNRA